MGHAERDYNQRCPEKTQNLTREHVVRQHSTTMVKPKQPVASQNQPCYKQRIYGQEQVKCQRFIPKLAKVVNSAHSQQAIQYEGASDATEHQIEQAK
jgi:hypothetical protein